MLRKVIFLGLMLLSAGFAGTSVAASPGSYFAEEPPAISGVPFSAVVKTQSTTAFSDGTHIVRNNTVRLFRDGQGRTRTERGLGADGTHPATMILINDPVAGVRYIVSPVLKFSQELPLRAGNMPEPSQGASSELDAPFALLGIGMGIGATPFTEASSNETSLGPKMISGVNTAGTRLVRTIPAGVLGNDRPITSTMDRWVSTDLNITVAIDQTSSIGGASTLNVSQITRAEPDASLFVPPADYKLHRFPGVAQVTATTQK